MANPLHGPSRADLPPRPGLLARSHRLLGDVLISTLNLRRPPLTLGARLIAFDEGGRVFLVRHSYVPGWHLPGGAVEPGESAMAAALREAAEEGGLILPEPPECFGIYANSAAWRHDHVAVFLARGVTGGAAGRGLEVLGAGFFAPDALPESASLAARARIAEALGAVRSDRW